MIANNASTRTTQLYNRWSDDVTLDDVERVLINQRLTGAKCSTCTCSKEAARQQ
jgi:hypothetical protein